MHTPEYIQSWLPDSPVIGQNWLSALIVHPLQGLSDRPDLAGQTILLTPDHTTLGRHASCQAQIKDGYISRVHATVYRKPIAKGIIYEIHDGDLQGKPSSNGLLVNGEKLQASALLEDGDWLQLGTRGSPGAW